MFFFFFFIVCFNFFYPFANFLDCRCMIGKLARLSVYTFHVSNQDLITV